METGWLADLIFYEGEFRRGLALITENGRIARVSGEPEDLARAQRLSSRAILPGLVNVHSHTFQRVIRGRTEHRTRAARDTFWTWRHAMYRAANALSPEDIYDAARMAFLEMLLSGITSVGEFHYIHHAPGGAPYRNHNLLAMEIVRAARNLGLRIALLRTAYVRAGWQKEPDPGQARFLTPRAADFVRDTEDLLAELAPADAEPAAWVGVAPHSVRAVPLEYLREVVSYARARDLPVHMHVAEQPAEIEACVAEYGLRPLELLQREGILDAGFTGVHAIHITPQEAGFLGSARAHVCACPTSERNLGDGAVPAEMLADAGAILCFGSDSNVQINLLEDARELEYHLRMNRLERAVLAPDAERESLARRLFASASSAGAASLRSPGGVLAAGRAADFFTVDLNDPSVAGADAGSLLSHIVFSLERTAIRDVIVSGKPVVQNGRHRLQEEIVLAFTALQQRIWSAAP